jgi:cytochrome c oxidase cbb3-type subunit III
MNTNNIENPEKDQEYGDVPAMNIEDHEYDGIKELDNPPPGWIMAVFYLTIGLSILYGAYYFWLHVGDQQEAEFAKSVEIAKIKYNKEPAGGPMAQLSDPESIAAGKSIYTSMNCMTCHGINGEGNAIGPNLTDNYWLHGCKFEDISNTIKNGNPTKGMIAFKAQLTDEKIQQVTSYIMSLKGSNPANAKAPQGEPCK